MQDIKDHIFFEGIDWEAVAQRKIYPVFVPKVESNIDLSNIDRFFTKEEPRETPTEDSILLQTEKFDKFTFEQKDSMLMSAGQNINTTGQTNFEEDTSDIII